MAKAQPREYAAELEVLARMKAHLEGGHLAVGLCLSEKEAEMLQPLNLLTLKPRLYVANVGEAELPNGGPRAGLVLDRARRESAQAVVLCAQLEADLADWSAEEAAEYRAELGLDSPCLDRLIHSGYELLHLITFFTATGTNVVRAWTLKRGQTAYEAAGKIHTDMRRGFIRAEVIAYPDLMGAGNFHLARERGLLRLEGREYIVQDGDIIHFRFSPPR
jgi:ribosome-binding ATPase YchF (GTP1/OBG family)